MLKGCCLISFCLMSAVLSLWLRHHSSSEFIDEDISWLSLLWPRGMRCRMLADGPSGLWRGSGCSDPSGHTWAHFRGIFPNPTFGDTPAESVLSSGGLILSQITVYQIPLLSDSSLNVHIASERGGKPGGRKGKVMLILAVTFGARYNRNQGHLSSNDLGNLISHIPCIPAKEINTGV